MKNTLKKGMVVVMAFALLLGAVSVPAQNAQAAAKEVTTKDVTKVKTKKGTVNPLAKYKKYTYAAAFYTKNDKNFQGTMRGIKIKSTLKQIQKKYGSDCKAQKVNNKYEKQLIKKMKLSGVSKKLVKGLSSELSSGENYLIIYFDKKNKVKAILIAKNYLMLQDTMMMNEEEKTGNVKFTVKGNVLYVK